MEAIKSSIKKHRLLENNKDHFVVQDPNGGEFKVAKHSIDPLTHQKIANLQIAQRAANNGSDDGSGIIPAKYSKGGKVKGYSGENAAPEDQEVEPQETPIQSATRLLTTDQASPVDQSPTISPTASDLDKSPQSSGTIEKMAETPPAGISPSGVPLQAAQNEPPSPLPAGLESAYGPGGLMEKSLNEQAAAAKQLGSAQSNAYTHLAAQQQVFQTDLKNHLAKLNSQSDSIRDRALSGEIDPNRLLSKGGNKILAAISIALGGIGAGLSGGRNLALDQINKAISNDIDAQKADSSNKNSLYSKNLEQTRNEIEATRLTYSQLTAATEAMLAKAGANNLSAQAQAVRDQGMAALQSQRYNLNYETAIQRAKMGFLNPTQTSDNPMAGISQKIGLLVDPDQRKDALKEASDYENSLKAQKSLVPIYKQLSEQQTLSQRVGHPFASRKEVDQLHANLNNIIYQSMDASKRPSPEIIEKQLDPFHVDIKDGPEEIEKSLKNAQAYIREHAPSTPILDSYKFTGKK